MLNGIDPALSVLRALGKKVEVTANNVANVDTEGFKKRRAILQEAQPSGVTVSIEQVNTPGAPLPPDEGKTGIRESSNVAVEEETVDLITTGHAYTANVKVLKAEDEILGTLLDVLAK